MKRRKLIISSLVVLLVLMICSSSVLAFQPGAHYILMEKTTKSLPEESIIRHALEEYPSIAAWGANGPDLGLIQAREVLGYAPWSDRYHYYNVGSFAAQQLQEALESNDLKKIAFAAGWVTHVAGDLACHGIYVNPEAGVYLDNPDGRELHMKLESMAEPFVWVDIGGYTISDYEEAGIDDKFGSVDSIPFDLMNSASVDVYGDSPTSEEEKSWAYTYLAGITTGVGYTYEDYNSAVSYLSSNNRNQRLRAAFQSALNRSVDLLKQAEKGDYSGFSDRWNLDVGRSDSPISSLTVTVHTGDEKRGVFNTEWAGTDDYVYFGITMKDGTQKEWMLDKDGYNDFEVDDNDEYYLYMNNPDIHPDDINEIWLRKEEWKYGTGGDWYVEEISVDINGHRAFDKGIKTWIDDDSSTWSTNVDWSMIDLDTDPDPENP